MAALTLPALADDDPQTTEPPTAEDSLPKPHSYSDPAPPVALPSVTLPPGGIIEQAGIGGDIAYGRAGVLELGGSAGLMMASKFRNVNIAPSLGWFVADNLELSTILGVSNIKAGNESATVWSALLEPSYHLPFNRTTFGFVGLGVGAAYVSQLGTGFAIAPRLGANLTVGRSGILTPSLSYEYTTHSVDSGNMQNVTLVSISSALRINIGYTAMW
ncbi:MAG TPA: hypothetical protein VHN14_07845 [Kofleriaceae bacterium]|nr:hypothetical protein [Kofleriaceae bacterium]